MMESYRQTQSQKPPVAKKFADCNFLKEVDERLG
jgi:hypothetical protein